MEQTQKNYIVTQCYGNEDIFYECAFALLSMSRLYGDGFLSNTEIWIYTDKPEWFSRFADCPLPVHFRKMDVATIAQWQGTHRFVHRLKIELLRDLVKNKQGNILYMDTDVVWTHAIDKMLKQIANGALYMHVQEGLINDGGNPVLKKLSAFLNTSKEIKTTDPKMGEHYMWNAGVLGFNTSHSYLLENVLALTDKIYPLYPKHVVEQFAFSYCFANETHIKAAAPYIIHYWNLKEMRKILAAFFTHFKDVKWSELAALAALLQPHLYMQEKAAFYQNRSIAGKLAKDKWQPTLPVWENLLHQL